MRGYFFGRNAKIYEHLKHSIRERYNAAKRAEHNWYVAGVLATALWCAGVVGLLPPPARAKNAVPHLLAFVVASSIATTVSQNVKNARTQQQNAVKGMRRLRLCQEQEELEELRRAWYSVRGR